jgi:hemoglobin
MTRIGAALPAGLQCYRRTLHFSPANVPAALLSSHSVKSGVWGLLRVINGRVRFCLDSGARDSAVVGEGGTAVIAPGVLHHVELLDAASTFYIEFHRAGPEE